VASEPAPRRVARVAGWLLGGAAGVAFGGNPPVGSGCTDLRGRPINFGVEWQTQVKPIVNELFPTGRCTSCHNPGQNDGGLDLTAASSTR
jgi:hypothetical protein